MNPSICACDDHESLSRPAAERIVSARAAKPDLLLCAAGGSTPLQTYRLRSQHRSRTPEAFRALRVVKLDEWGGLWDVNRSGGGVTMDMGCHAIEFFCWMLGRPPIKSVFV